MGIILVLVCLAGCGSSSGHGLTRFSYTQVQMGSPARIVLFARDEAQARVAARAAYARLAELDSILSDYRQDSETNRLCAQPAGRWTAISSDLFRVLDRARGISEQTGGSFDCTVGPLTRRWREARREGKLPPARELAELRTRVGWTRVALDPQAQAARLEVEGMGLDFGGIGKGYAADRAVEVMRGLGVSRCLVDFGGDVAAGDPPPGARAWRVEIETGYGSGPRPVVWIANGGVATSGDTEQFIEFRGRRYSHILDPATGLGLTTRTAATVVACDGATADALASAACVLGAERAERLLGHERGVGVRLVVDGEPTCFGPARSKIRAK
jgi:thiamine biosynthesis lipoprotein